jgi:hypothetical protein
MVVGGLAVLVSLGFLVFTAMNATAEQAVAASRNIEIFEKVLLVGVLGLGVGASYQWWGEEILGVVQLFLAGAMYFAPLILPSVVPNSGNSPAYGQALSAIQLGGMVYGIIALIVTTADVIIRVKDRSKTGVKADQLKYGRGVKEEKDRQNVLLGKCWQLPFCRKFVRERCPIYHAKRTCWKELVGCMCEEAIIRNSMENRPIPKDELLAANLIPRNNKLTIAQKKERCRSCVIYNEHQRHKYKVYMPMVVIFYVAAYVLLRTPLLAATETLLSGINKVVQAGTLNKAGNFTPPHSFVEMLLAVFFIIALTYSMKILEFTIFRAKV